MTRTMPKHREFRDISATVQLEMKGNVLAATVCIGYTLQFGARQYAKSSISVDDMFNEIIRRREEARTKLSPAAPAAPIAAPAATQCISCDVMLFPGNTSERPGVCKSCNDRGTEGAEQ